MIVDRRLSSLISALVFVALVPRVIGNTALTDSWEPLEYGECTKEPIEGMEFTSPPYTGDNADPEIGEGVGYSPPGLTCGFSSSVSDYMPTVWTAGYVLAAAQDIYAGMHLPVCDSCSNKNEDWEAICQPYEISRDDAADGVNMCSLACGQCFIISGTTNTSSIWIVNEIADVNAVGQNGEGLNFHLDTRHCNEVRDWFGVSKDIWWKPVPCPVSGSIHILVSGNWGDVAVYLTVLNHKVAMAAMEARGGVGGDQEWVPLVRDWTNRWHWESYGCDTCISWQNGYGGIQRGSTNNDFDLRLTSVDGQQVICRGLFAESAGSVMDCVDEFGEDVQFSDVSGVDGGEACDGSRVLPPEGGGGGGGISDGGIAALVIVFVVLPAGLCGGAIAWVVYRKKTGKEVIPSKIDAAIKNLKSKLPSKS
ncbi:hypothetical protein Pelo_8949 [Pelomyxa schiedti]|nr:hypothetical protein Pelo_8949 [Pelomyxa schiedti]